MTSSGLNGLSNIVKIFKALFVAMSHPLRIFCLIPIISTLLPFCILQIGELAVSLTQEYRDSTKNRIQWKQIRETRNIVVHNYGNVNLKIVWAVATYDIPELRRFCDEQLASEEQANEL